jgi:predicted Zn-dependent peptidase
MIAAFLTLALTAAVPAPLSSRSLPARAGRPAAMLAQRPGPRAALVVRFQVGSVDDATRDGPAAGLGHVAQLAMIHANRRLDAIEMAKEVFASDGELAVVTGLETCEFRLEAARGDFDRLADRLVSALLDPAIQGGAAFEAVRDKALHDRRAGRGGEGVEEIARVVVPEAAYRAPPNGDRDVLERLTPEDVRGHVARWFVPANATLVFAGAFDARKAEALARRFAGGARATRVALAVATPMAMMSPSRRELYVAVFRRPAPVPPAAWLLAAILDERLEALRDRGVTYAYSVEVTGAAWLSGLALIVPVAEGDGPAAMREVEAILAELRSGKVTQEELVRNREHLLGELERIDGSAAELARELSRGSGTFGPEQVAALERLDAAEVARTAAELLREDAAIRVLFSPTAERAAPLPTPAAGETP